VSFEGSSFLGEMISCFSMLMRQYENLDHRAAFGLQVGQLVIRRLSADGGTRNIDS